MGPFVFTIQLEDAEGTLAGQIIADVMGATQTFAAERVAKRGDDLRIDYTTEFDGEPIPISIFIIPSEGDTFRASLDVAGGLFSATGVAKKS